MSLRVYAKTFNLLSETLLCSFDLQETELYRTGCENPLNTKNNVGMLPGKSLPVLVDDFWEALSPLSKA